MSNHVSHKKLIDFFLADNRKKNQDIFEHIQTCDSCAKLYHSVENLFAQRKNDAIHTSRKLDDAIALAIHKQQVSVPAVSVISRMLSLFGQSLKFAASGALLVCAIVLYKGEKSENYLNEIATLHYGTGVVQVNNTAVTKQIALNEKSVIQTDANTFAHIRFKDNSIVTIGEHSSLEIVNSSVPGKSGKEQAWSSVINLKKGAIHCNFRHEKFNIIYALITPQAYIDTIGTRFYLSSLGNDSSLILTEGKVRVKTATEEKLIGVSDNNKYILSGAIAMARMSAGDAAIMSAFMKYSDSIDGNEAGDSTDATKNNSGQVKDPQNQKQEVQDRMRDTKREMRKNMRDQRKEMNNMKRHMKKERRQNGKKN